MISFRNFATAKTKKDTFHNCRKSIIYLTTYIFKTW